MTVFEHKKFQGDAQGDAQWFSHIACCDCLSDHLNITVCVIYKALYHISSLDVIQVSRQDFKVIKRSNIIIKFTHRL